MLWNAFISLFWFSGVKCVDCSQQSRNNQGEFYSKTINSHTKANVYYRELFYITKSRRICPAVVTFAQLFNISNLKTPNEITLQMFFFPFLKVLELVWRSTCICRQNLLKFLHRCCFTGWLVGWLMEERWSWAELKQTFPRKQQAELVFISIIFVKDSIILRRHTIAVCEMLRWGPVCADREMSTNASFWIKLLNKGIDKLLVNNWTSLNVEGKTHAQTEFILNLY